MDWFLHEAFVHKKRNLSSYNRLLFPMIETGYDEPYIGTGYGKYCEWERIQREIDEIIEINRQEEELTSEHHRGVCEYSPTRPLYKKGDGYSEIEDTSRMYDSVDVNDSPRNNDRNYNANNINSNTSNDTTHGAAAQAVNTTDGIIARETNQYRNQMVLEAKEGEEIEARAGPNNETPNIRNKKIAVTEV